LRRRRAPRSISYLAISRDFGTPRGAARRGARGTSLAIHWRMTSTRALLALLVAGIVTCQVGCAAEAEEDDTDQSADAITGGRIVVRQFGSPGTTIGKWGYDIKQPGRARALKPALAKEIFGDIGMNLLRIPVLAAEAHPSKGVGNIRRGEYADHLEAIKNVKAVKPGVDVFASLRLLGDKSFPGWVKDGGDVSAAKYAELLQDYLAFMKENGVTIDWLGIDNERKFNEGNITPAKYNAIVSDVKAWCRKNDVKVPGFVAAEDYGAAENIPWLQNLAETPAQFQHADAVGVHSYSKHRTPAYVGDLERLGKNDRGKALWDTELHWNDRDDDDAVRFDDIKAGMLLTMDHFDVGFRALSWWAFQPRSMKTKSAHVMSELVATTVGAATLATDDVDGKAPAMGKLNSRAFKNGPNQVTVWVANFDNKDHKSLWTEIANQKVAAASYVQWSAGGPDAGKTGNASLVKKNDACFSMNYPSNTITRVSVTLK